MDYLIIDLDDSVIKSINTLVKLMCKEKNINYEKQNYKILFSNEKLFVKNNNVRYTSGLKNLLCFYGKTYSNKNGKIIENIHLEDALFTFEPKVNSLLIIYGGIDNSTVVDSDEELLYFYVAPANLLELQDPILWQTL